MKKHNSVVLGFAGILLIFISLIVGTYSTGIALISGIITAILGLDISFVLSFGVAALIISLGMFLVGLKLVVTNENPLITFLIGLIGLIFAIVGIAVGIGSSGTGIFFTLVLVAIGIAFMGYGWKIDVLNPLGRLIDQYKRFF